MRTPTSRFAIPHSGLVPDVERLLQQLEGVKHEHLVLNIVTHNVSDCAQVQLSNSAVAVLAAVDVPCAAQLRAAQTEMDSPPPILWQNLDVPPTPASDDSVTDTLIAVGCGGEARWTLLERIDLAMGLRDTVLVTDYQSRNATQEWRGPVVAFDGAPSAALMQRIVDQHRPVLVIDV